MNQMYNRLRNKTMIFKVCISVITVFVSATFLSGCSGTRNSEHEEKDSAESHADEIIFTDKQAKEAGLVVEEVTPGDFASVIKTSGRILSPLGEEHTVVATANGIVSFVNSSLAEGSAVNGGQPLATISARQLQDGDPRQKERMTYETAKREYERLKMLVADKIVSEKEFEEARLRYELAREAFEAVAANLTKNGVAVSSPIGGFVKSMLVRQGDYVSVGAPLVTVAQDRRLQLRAEVPESSFRYLKTVSSANFKPSYDSKIYRLSELNGKLVSYGKSSGTDSYYLPVTFEFDNVGDFVAGSFAEVFLLGRTRKNVISLPKSALTEEQGLFFVYVQVRGEKDAFLKKEVTVGQDNGERVEIAGGLAAGDLVVVKGAYQVKLAASSTAIPEGHNHNH